MASQSELGLALRPAADVDSEELAELTARLADHLRELGDAGELGNLAVDVGGDDGGSGPEGAKGIGLLAIGALVVRFVRRPEVLRTLIDYLARWLRQQPLHSITLSIDGDTCTVTGVSSADRERLIDLWIARHGEPG